MLIDLSQIEKLVAKDTLRTQLLTAVCDLKINDWYIAAGCIRNFIWDNLYGNKITMNFTDIDVIYFDPTDTTQEHDLYYEDKLNIAIPGFNWSVKNQARMHLRNQDAPYQNSLDAMRFWPEKQTAIGVTISEYGKISVVSPFSDSLFMDCITRNPIKNNITIFQKRLATHDWLTKWPQLQVEY